MLVNFKVKNFRSFYEETLFSMQATANKEHAELNTFTIDEKLLPKNENELLKSAIIFGANASGKSNIIKALKFMQFIILSSADQRIPAVRMNEPFAFYNFTNNEPTAFEVDFITNGVFYNYGFEIVSEILKVRCHFRKISR